MSFCLDMFFFAMYYWPYVTLEWVVGLTSPNFEPKVIGSIHLLVLSKNDPKLFLPKMKKYSHFILLFLVYFQIWVELHWFKKKKELLYCILLVFNWYYYEIEFMKNLCACKFKNMINILGHITLVGWSIYIYIFFFLIWETK